MSPPSIPTVILRDIFATGEGAPPKAQKLERIASIRAHSPEASRELDCAMVDHHEHMSRMWNEAQADQEEMRKLIEKVTSPPLYSVDFLGVEMTPQGVRARVASEKLRTLVTATDDIDLEALTVGQELFLNNQRNIILSASRQDRGKYGEVYKFVRMTQDDRLVLQLRGEQCVARPGDSLKDVKLKEGDLVLYNPSTRVAYEKIGRSEGSDRFLEEMPSETFDDIGGLTRQIRRIQTIIELQLYHKDVVEKFKGRPKRGIILYGPPGTGKTMIVRALVNWLRSISPAGKVHFINVKPGELKSKWHGEDEENYREVFRVAREASRRDPDIPVVIYFDELDGIGATRGSAGRRTVEDRTMPALMGELDGLEKRGNILVIASTNRIDMVDEGLLRAARFGDLKLEVPRPSMIAAADILRKHLRADIPYDAGHVGGDAAAAREEIIDTAVSTVFSPNGANKELATITFRDGEHQVVGYADLICGASLANIAQSAIELAQIREVETGRSGVRLEDVLTAVEEAGASAVAALTRENCLNYLPNLSHDRDVVDVSVTARKTKASHQYLNLNVA